MMIATTLHRQPRSPRRQGVGRRRQPRRQPDVIVADGHEQRQLAQPAAQSIDGPVDGVGKTDRVRRNASPRAVPVAEPQRGDGAAVGALPAKRVRRLVGSHAAPQDGAVDAQERQPLRQLRRMTELIRHVAEPHGAAQLLGAPNPRRQVAQQRFAVDEQGVGLRIPRSNVEPPGAHQLADARLGRRPHLQIVVDHGDLAVEREVQPLVLLQIVERVVHGVDEVRAKNLERLVPLAIPVGVRDQGDFGRRHAESMVQATSRNQVRGLARAGRRGGLWGCREWSRRVVLRRWNDKGWPFYGYAFCGAVRQSADSTAGVCPCDLRSFRSSPLPTACSASPS